ncbi:hypothetical protein DESC_160032 [Desulfosarcina cetonica]|nr:hypothetical protein DESC_160032 [Desulfosarcina cetonica]
MWTSSRWFVACSVQQASTTALEKATATARYVIVLGAPTAWRHRIPVKNKTLHLFIKKHHRPISHHPQSLPRIGKSTYQVQKKYLFIPIVIILDIDYG